MSNTLLKNAPLIRLVSPAEPSVQGTPGTPAWDQEVVTTNTIHGPIIAWMVTATVPNLDVGGFPYEPIILGATKPTLPFDLGDGYKATAVVPIYGKGTTTTTTTVIHHPAVPAVPGTPYRQAITQLVDNVGWNAGANSVGSFTDDGQYQFSIPADVVGVVTGLDGASSGVSYQEISYGLFFYSGLYYVIENGVEATGPASYAGTDVFSVVRTGNVVRYWQNSTLVFASSVVSYGTLAADCSIYFGNDQIVNASLSDVVDSGFQGGSSGGTGPGTGVPPLGGGTGAGSGLAPPSGGFSAPGGNSVNNPGGGDGTDPGISLNPPIGGAGPGGGLGGVPGVGGPTGISGSGTGGTSGPGGSGYTPPGGTPGFDYGDDGSGGRYFGGAGGVGGSYFRLEGGGSDADSGASARGAFKVIGTGGRDNTAAIPQPGVADPSGTASGSFSLYGQGFGTDSLSTQYAYAAGVFALGDSGTASGPAPVGSGGSGGAGGAGLGGGGGQGGGGTPQVPGSSSGSGGPPPGSPGAPLTPPYAEARGVVTPFQAFGYTELQNPGDARGSFEVTGFGSNFAYTEARGSFALDGLGASFGTGVGYADILLFTQPYIFIAIGNLLPYDRGVTATLPSLTLQAYGSGVSSLALPSLTLSASGTVTAVARLAAALPALALTASGTAPSVGRLSTSLPDGYALAAWGGATSATSLPALSGTASGTVPSVGRLTKTLPVSFSLTAYAGGAYAEPLPVPVLSASGTVTALAALSEALPRPLAISARAGARLSLALPEVALEASGTSASLGSLIKRLPRGFALTAYSGGAASGTLPSAKLSASGTSASLGRLGTTLPRGFALTAYAGGASVGRLKAPTLTASGTSASLGRLAKTLPRGFALSAYAGGAAVLSTKSLVLSASGSAPIVGRLSATLPLLTLQAEPGGYAALRLPVLSISASGTAWTVGRLSGTLPVPTFLGSGTVTQLASLSVSLPALRTVSSGVLSVLLPKLQGAGYSVLSTSGPVLSTENSEAYSITLLDDGTVAVTRYTQYPFNQIHRWQGKYYGVADDGVYELTGDTFDGTPIVSVIETMETDFDRPEFKRAPALYLSGRIGADFNVAVLSSELETDTYPTYRPTSKPGASTHRCVFGQGIRAHYYAYSMTNINGEDFTIDSFQTDIDTTAHRI